jgi:hypothetical protein
VALLPSYPIPADALTLAIGDAYEKLLFELENSLSGPDPFESPNVLDYYEEHLADCPTPAARIRYLCRLTLLDGPGDTLFRRVILPGLSQPATLDERRLYSATLYGCFGAAYFGWLAVRLTEAVCALAGSTRLRQGRADLAAEWESIATRRPSYRPDEPHTVSLLYFLFGVLVPFASDSRPQSIGNIAQQVRQAAARPAAGPRPPAPPPEPLPQTLQMLCQGGLTPANVRELLAHPGAVDADTSRWHLGEVTGKPAKYKSAFPAAYRALANLGLLKQMEGPVWLKIFVSEFAVDLSPRMANYDTKGQVSKIFHEFYSETLRWAKVWQAKREAEE